MLESTYFHNVDAKGRIFMPVKLREDLGDVFHVTVGIDGRFLTVYTEEGWNALGEKMENIPLTNVTGQNLKRKFYANASECVPDKQGRIMLTPQQRNYMNLEKEAVVIGIQNRVEIWSKEEWEKSTMMDVMSAEELDSLSELGI